MKHIQNFDGEVTPAPNAALAANLTAGYRRVEEKLRTQGWAEYDLADLPYPPWLVDEFPAFAKLALRDLRPDPDDKTGQRNRRYGRYLWIPSLDTLLPIARDSGNPDEIVTHYVQGADFQPEHGGRVRKFAALTEPVFTSAVLRALIEADFRVAREAEVLPESTVYLVGVHVQQLAPKRRGKSVITPDIAHRDGELATFVHMVEVVNVKGGWNAVTTLEGVGHHPLSLPSEQVLARFALSEPGAGFVVDDRKVGHFVEGVSRANPALPGHRTTILIDFCPVKWVVSTDL